MLASNVRVGRHEIDLLVRDADALVAVEVKSGASALDHFTPSKEDSLRLAMARIRPRPVRLDLITVEPQRSGLLVRWYRGGA